MLKGLKRVLTVLLTVGIIISPNYCYANQLGQGKFKTSSQANQIDFENYEREVLDKFIPKLVKQPELKYAEQAFLNGLVRKYRPKKILEIGVSEGGSSAILLNASKDIEGSKVYSIDKLPVYYRDYSKATGHIVKESCPELAKRWTLYTDGIACDFIDKIGDGIDFVFIDTMHIRPGEILDFLTVLPYLNENAIVCFHDIGASFNWGLGSKPCYYSNDVLFSSIKGEKFLPKTEYNEFFPNIGAVRLESNQSKNLLDYFLLLSLPWEYIPENEENYKIIKHFERHYDQSFADMFINGLIANKKYYEKVRIK